jgi:hypothetical protein
LNPRTWVPEASYAYKNKGSLRDAIISKRLWILYILIGAVKKVNMYTVSPNYKKKKIQLSFDITSPGYATSRESYHRNCQFLPERQSLFHLPSRLKSSTAVSLFLKWQWLKHNTSVLCPYFYPCSWPHALANTKSENRSKATCCKGHTLLYLRLCIATGLKDNDRGAALRIPTGEKFYFILQSFQTQLLIQRVSGGGGGGKAARAES